MCGGRSVLPRRQARLQLSDHALLLSLCLLVHVFRASLLWVSYSCCSLLLYSNFFYLAKLSGDFQSFLCAFFRPSQCNMWMSLLRLSYASFLLLCTLHRIGLVVYETCFHISGASFRTQRHECPIYRRCRQAKKTLTVGEAITRVSLIIAAPSGQRRNGSK